MTELIPLILYGDSLFLDGIEVKLCQDARFKTSRIHFKSLTDLEELEYVEEGFLIYDRSFTDDQAIQVFLAEHPGFKAVSLCAEEKNVQICTEKNQQDYLIQGIAELSDILEELGLEQSREKDLIFNTKRV